MNITSIHHASIRRSSVRRIITPIALILGPCIVLSVIWGVPYIFTLIGLSVWVCVDHLDDDDDLIAEQNKSYKNMRVFWRVLGLKAAILVTLCFFALMFPAIRNLGA
jgi:hypothetical protein